MAADGLGLDFLTQIVNVHWDEGEDFLYSGGDGMVGSHDGVNWEPMPSSIPALSMAFIDDCWIAITGNGGRGYYRSEDSAKSWQAFSPPSGFFDTVAAMQPLGPDGKPKLDSNGEPVPAWFAMSGQSEDGNNYVVFTSNDKGDSWKLALSVDASRTDTSQEFGTKVDGCGGAFFYGSGKTTYNDFGTYGEGFLYVSTDGLSFSGPTMVFGPGYYDADNNSLGYENGGVGYDNVTKQYALTGFKQTSSLGGGTSNFLMYKKSSTPHFGAGDGAVFAESNNPPGGGGTTASGGVFVAGGGGYFATGYHIMTSFTGTDDNFDIYAVMLPGAPKHITSVLFNQSGYPFSSVAYAKGKEEATKEAIEGSGTFCCTTSFGTAKIFTAKPGGSFSQTHAGPPILLGANSVFNCVAAGKVTLKKDDGNGNGT